MAQLTKIEAARAAQAMLREEHKDLRVDGWWGSFTQGKFDASSRGLRDAVRRVLATSGESPESLFTETRKKNTMTVTTAGTDWVPARKADALAERAAAEFGLDADIMKKFLRLEAAQKTIGGELHFNAKSVAPNGNYRGLYQMGTAAWTDVRSAIGVGYDQVFDPWVNTRAAAAYVKNNFDALRARGYTGPLTADVAYAAHNQGVAGFMRILRTRTTGPNFANQSRKAQQVIRTAAAASGVSLA